MGGGGRQERTTWEHKLTGETLLYIQLHHSNVVKQCIFAFYIYTRLLFHKRTAANYRPEDDGYVLCLRVHQTKHEELRSAKWCLKQGLYRSKTRPIGLACTTPPLSRMATSHD